MAKKGFDIDRKIVTMKDIKKVGEYEAVVHFHKEVEVKVPVTVVAENAEVIETPKDEEASATEAPVAEEAPATEAATAE